MDMNEMNMRYKMNMRYEMNIRYDMMNILIFITLLLTLCLDLVEIHSSLLYNDTACECQRCLQFEGDQSTRLH